MGIHKELVEKIAQEMYSDENILSLILYGSVSRNEESKNSDIDLLIIVKEYHLQKKHIIRDGITIELVEMHIDFLNNFIMRYEIPMIFALAKGLVLFNKLPKIDELILHSKKIIEQGPPINTKWDIEEYRTKKRNDLTEIYLDLLDVDDEIEFNYLSFLMVTTAIPMLLEINHLWPQTRKKTIHYLEIHCNKGYQYIKILLSNDYSLIQKREAAKGLVNYMFRDYGGMLEGEAVIFDITKL